MMMIIVHDYVYMRPLADWNIDTHPGIVGPGKDMVVVETHSGTTSPSHKIIPFHPYSFKKMHVSFQYWEYLKVIHIQVAAGLDLEPC